MLKIVDIHPAATVSGEYVVLQNQGMKCVSLRGSALCTDAYLCGDLFAASHEMFVFTHDVTIKPYIRVVLFTGSGQSGWHPTTDGKQAYLVYWDRPERIWSLADHIHLLQIAASRKV